jgi:hypothetical protein
LGEKYLFEEWLNVKRVLDYFLIEKRGCHGYLKKHQVFLSLFIVTFTISLNASIWTNWTEYPGDPIYNPFPSQTLPEDYFPYVVFDRMRFNGNGNAVNYKMWHQGADPNGSIAISYSNDGINWTLKGETNLTSPLTTAFHPVVLYDKNGFGGISKPYRMWFWTGVVSSTNVGVIQYTLHSSAEKIILDLASKSIRIL